MAKKKIIVDIDCEEELCGNCDAVDTHCSIFGEELEDNDDCMAIRLTKCKEAEAEAIWKP